MPHTHPRQSRSHNEERLPEKHYKDEFTPKYGSGRLPEKQIFAANVVSPTASADAWDTWPEPELETKPLTVMPSERAGMNLQQQAASRYLSLSIPLQPVRTENIDLRNVAYSRGARSKRAPLVIPGTRSQEQRTEELALLPKRLHPTTQWGIAIFSMLCIFLFCMLTLTPIGRGGGSDFSVVKVSRTQGSILFAANGGGAGIDGGTITNDMAASSIAYYQNLARQDALKWGIPPDYYVRQIQQESHFDPNAVSFAGAIGIAQFEPETAAEYHFDPHDPVQSLDGGAHFMSDLDRYFGGDYRKALAGYNAGAGAVDNAVAACGNAWLSCLSGQTQAYVVIIAGY